MANAIRAIHALWLWGCWELDLCLPQAGQRSWRGMKVGSPASEMALGLSSLAESAQVKALPSRGNL